MQTAREQQAPVVARALETDDPSLLTASIATAEAVPATTALVRTTRATTKGAHAGKGKREGEEATEEVEAEVKSGADARRGETIMGMLNLDPDAKGERAERGC